MASKMLAYVVAIVVIVAIAAYLLSSTSAGTPMSKIAVQLTDPPNVPSGTQSLIVAYSSVQVHVENGTGQTGTWVNASGSGTANLMALLNVSKTIASADVAANSTINLVRFSITSAQVVIDNTTYNVTVPSSQINIAITGQQKLNSSAAAVLVDLFPTVNSHPAANGTAYVLVPAARAIVVNSNSTVSINTNVGSTASVNGSIGVRLGLGLGLGSGGHNSTGRGNTSPGFGATVSATAKQRVSNFLVQNVSFGTGTVLGLLYVLYPVASTLGVNTTLHINSTIGYACDNSEYVLSNIFQNGTAVFTQLNTSSHGGCPV